MSPFKADARQLSGAEIRRLIELRETVKVESLHLPRTLQHKLLEILETSRPWQVPPPPLPEMSRGELIRAIRWRLGTIPLAGAEAAAEFIKRHRARRHPAPRATGRRTSAARRLR